MDRSTDRLHSYRPPSLALGRCCRHTDSPRRRQHRPCGQSGAHGELLLSPLFPRRALRGRLLASRGTWSARECCWTEGGRGPHATVVATAVRPAARVARAARGKSRLELGAARAAPRAADTRVGAREAAQLHEQHELARRLRVHDAQARPGTPRARAPMPAAGFRNPESGSRESRNRPAEPHELESLD